MKRFILTMSVFWMAINVGVIASTAAQQSPREYHVSPQGDDANDGSPSAMLKTISAAAGLAQPGDIITVHKGVYRERVNPPRGGESDDRRIVYQTALGDRVEIKGSEVVTGWEKVQNDTWKVVLPNSFFGDYNPYKDLIHGDWFTPKGREHHTGAVYLDGHWLIEAAKLEEVMAPAGTVPEWLNDAGQEYLLNVAWLRTSPDAPQIAATSFKEKNGTQNAACEEGGDCIGFIMNGHWVKYKNVDFKDNIATLEIRAASAGAGGNIEIRLDNPDGELLGTCPVPNTGGWQSWTTFKAEIKPVSGVKDLVLVFKSFRQKTTANDVCLWYGRVDEENTTLWAQFKGINPNERQVEINVRRTVFYPELPGMNYITVRGFIMRHAATQWAPPTSEQVGLIGTHWSKGWIIENNEVSYSVCSGIALGKHGDEFDNTSADTAEGYVKTIERAIARGWSKENIGHHIVRNNTISHCEQTGIVGSLGAIFSTITGNTIHDVHVRKLFTGAEMAGIKLHAAIDVEIRNNHIYNTCLGLWLDWMAQGARISGNLFHDNDRDLFVEVDHGPFVVDNNMLLSSASILTVSRGGTFAHNLIAGSIDVHPYDARLTPYHKAHSTEIAGMHDNPAGDDRYYNNLISGQGGLSGYNKARLPVWMDGNVFFNEAVPCKEDKNALVLSKVNPMFRVVEQADGLYLEGLFDSAWAEKQTRKLVATEMLGKALVPDLPYENRDGSPLRLDSDYAGTARNPENPFPGPFEFSGDTAHPIPIWPVNVSD